MRLFTRPLSAAALCLEAQRATPLVADPFACRLAEAIAGDADGDVVPRTAFVDRMLLDAVSRRLRQLVLWRSGTDTRAFRALELRLLAGEARCWSCFQACLILFLGRFGIEE